MWQVGSEYISLTNLIMIIALLATEAKRGAAERTFYLFSATPKLGFASASFKYENAANAGREVISEQLYAKPLV